MNTIFAKCAVPALLFGALAAPIAANASPRSEAVAARLTGSRILDNGVNHRFDRQQHRIGRGIETGALTPREAGRLERREYKMRLEAYSDRSAHEGRLTRYEHRRLERQINRTSAAIYRDKHNLRRGY